MLHSRSFVVTFFRLSLNRKRNAVVSQETRSKLSQTRRRRARCKMACVALKSSSPSNEVERAHERRYIFYFVRLEVRARGFLKQRHRPLWFMPRLPRSFLIPRSYVNNLSCNRSSESKTNGTAFGKLLASENLLRLLLLFQERRDEWYLLFINVRYVRSRHPLWFIIIPSRKRPANSMQEIGKFENKEASKSYVKDIRITKV